MGVPEQDVYDIDIVGIIQLVARGLSNSDIAGELVVSENTVKTHIKNILSKLQSKNRSEAVAYASKLGYLPPEKTDGRD